MGGLQNKLYVKQCGRKKKACPDPRHPPELETDLNFMEGFYVEGHGHGNTEFHDSEYSKDDITALKMASPRSQRVF